MLAAAFLERFTALDLFLTRHQHLWRPRPFVERELAWESSHAELARWLRARSLEEAEAAHNTPQLLAAPEPFRSLAETSLALSQVHAYPDAPGRTLSGRQDVDVPGRKWLQIEAFSRKLDFRQPVQRWVDWCAGKGHLARHLTHQGAPAVCLEFDAALVEEGERLSHRGQAPVHHYQADVLQPLAGDQLGSRDTPVALHACGDLHTRLLRVTAARGCQQLALAPCCYDRISTEVYDPLSTAAQASALRLDREALRLALCETVTGGQRVRRDRDLSMARRLGFDLLQRELSGRDVYLNTPPLPSHWLRQPFSAFGAELARRKALKLPAAIDWPLWERRGFQRLAEVRNLELLRGLFRRPLELWLVLDQALFLQEQGYSVMLGTFCPASLTPRNLLLSAEKPCPA
ncbi:methyltransferase [Pseudomonas oryzihabitans]|uniref:methyltransferase n=1 Tax=Pseudomonas oryzihabitans TaxID=47885 RepID=UPI0011A48975|nr:methyltransferase [Pseudomonas oryzihabitans]